jgi:hypothetical protein
VLIAWASRQQGVGAAGLRGVALAGLALLLAAPLLLGVAALACQPGYYEYNQSGLFICVPSAPVSLEFTGILWSAAYDGSTLNLTASNIDNTSHTLTVRVEDPNGSLLYERSDELAAGSVWNTSIALEGYGYLVLELEVDGYGMGPYAVPAVEYVRGASGLASQGGALGALLVPLVAVAPLLTVAVMGGAKEAGLGVIAVSFFSAPWLAYWGAPVKLVLVLPPLLFVLGLIVVLASQ